MKTRKTILSYIAELSNRGFINFEENQKIVQRINNYYNGWGLK